MIALYFAETSTLFEPCMHKGSISTTKNNLPSDLYTLLIFVYLTNIKRQLNCRISGKNVMD